ncbi:MAG TPA: ribonuclease HII [Smithellaceae bacterium]|nr:ribonuclease HII [Smithellaceae bacterium]
MVRFEKLACQEGYKLIAGVDEAGRGPLAGPVVAAAVIFPVDYQNSKINDSKRLSAVMRESLYDVIRNDAIAVGVGIADTDVIDKINILQASLQAMREAVLDLAKPVEFLLVDGLYRVALPVPQKPIVKGDSLSVSIAAASIIAKVSRDRIMDDYHRQFPQYDFKKKKGYGTKKHCEAIREFGLCKIHRRSFHLKNQDGIQKALDLAE